MARVSIVAMTVRLRLLFLSPVFLIALTAFLTAFVVQSGELGTSDTTHRLQTAHSFWTSQPPVFPNEYPEFGIHGRGGKLYSWYGIGQSLLMLPADIVGTYVNRLPVFKDYGDDPVPRSIVVSYGTNILVCVLSVLVCYRLLGLFDFTINQRVAGVLALLFCTTFLHYTQNMMENNYIFLLTMTGLVFQYEWVRTGGRRSLLIGTAALGLNLLTRLTTGLDLLAVSLFIVLVLWFTGIRGSALGLRIAEYVKFALPVYLLFGALDRAYQYYRFGSLFNTYVQLYGREQRMLDQTLPPNFPFNGSFLAGFLGPLFKPEKSVFLFDPLLILTLLVSFVAWKHFQPEIRAYLIAFGSLLAGYMAFYAKYYDWAGDFAWGDRYVSTAVQIVAFISVSLMMRHSAQLGRVVCGIGVGLAAAALLVQIASVMFWCPLEIYQMETLGHPTFVIWLRLKNIVAFAVGKMDQWGLTNDAMREDPWDYVHITTYNFLPFLLARVGRAPDWVVRLTQVIWFAGLGSLFVVLAQVRRCFTRGVFDRNSGEMNPIGEQRV
jgi:hypothetical protein